MGIEGDAVLISEKILWETKQKILEEISHPYLKKQLEFPKIDETILQIVLYFLSSKELPPKNIMDYSKSVMLIQMALDIHDLVPIDDLICERQNSQLQVLAGDYYSGLYYKILAEVPNIELIRYLAEGIHIVNEKKVSIYNREVTSALEYVTSMQRVETAVFQKLAAFLQDEVWELLISKWIHLHQIVNKREQYEQYILKNELPLENDKNLPAKEQKEASEWLERYIQQLKEDVNIWQRQVPGLDYFLSTGERKDVVIDDAYYLNRK